MAWIEHLDGGSCRSAVRLCEVERVRLDGDAGELADIIMSVAEARMAETLPEGGGKSEPLTIQEAPAHRM